MNTLDTLMKRKHVRRYDDKDIPNETINHLLEKSWKATSSKNNFMAYKIHVLDNTKKFEKQLVWQKCVSKQIASENQAKEDEQGVGFKGTPNQYYHHIKENSHLLIFTGRVCEPNEFMKDAINDGHIAHEMYPEYVNDIIDNTAIEVGMFTSHLTLFCMEENIDVSYTACFPRKVRKWFNLPFIEQRPILLMSLGYGEEYRNDILKKKGQLKKDYKPSKDTIISWK